MEKTMVIVINILITVNYLPVLLYLRTSSTTQNVVATLQILDIRNQQWNWQV